MRVYFDRRVPADRTAISRDGTQLAVVSGGMVTLYNTETESEVRRLTTSSGALGATATDWGRGKLQHKIS